MWPADRERRLVAAAFWGLFLLPVIGVLASDTHIAPLWTMSNYTLLPVLLLSSPAIRISRIDLRNIVAAAIAFPVIAMISAPAVAVYIHRHGIRLPDAHTHLLAVETERVWHQVTPQPLRYVGGNDTIAFGVVAYAQDRPHALPGIPAPDAQKLRQSGMVMVCFWSEDSCIQDATARAAENPASRLVNTTITRTYSGTAGAPGRYTLFIVPPQR
jgi:hypothetical protein